MTSQFTFFARATPELPEGLHYQPALITEREESALLERVRELPFKEFEFHGFKGKRRTVSFGWQYEFSGHGRLRKAKDVPEFLLSLRADAAKFAHLEPESLQHVLVVEYGPGAGIGWHRDRPVFGEVIGVSLRAPCVLRFRRKATRFHSALSTQHSALGTSDSDRVRDRRKSTWERINFLAETRSAYHLTGPSRFEWQHSILRVDDLRYSITFRTMRTE